MSAKMLRNFALSIYFLMLVVAPFSLKGHADYYPSYGSSSYGSGGFNYNYGNSPYGSGGSGSSSGSKVMSLELDPKKILNSDFRVAAREGRVADVEKMIKEGADVNSQSETGETALMYSARQCSLETTQTLMDAHADINKRDSSGQNALMFAVMSACEPVVRLILKDPSVSLEASDASKHTAMDYSVEATEMEVDGPSLKILHLLKRAQRHHARLAGSHSRHHSNSDSDA
jgi:hypothetical protein